MYVAGCLTVLCSHVDSLCQVLHAAGADSTWACLQAYRELLCTTPGLGEYISGAILFEETLYQNTTTGSTMVDELNKQGIVPGTPPSSHSSWE